MSNSTPLNAINKIHVTKMTLSDRFTAFSERPKINPRTSHDYINSPVSQATSIANRRLLKQLAQKHTMEAALKLKRRSMKARAQTTAAYKRVSNGQPLKRGSIKALRLGPSGRLLKANSITNVATMEADFLGRRSPRRANSVSRISDRIGLKRLQSARNPRRVGGRQLWASNVQSNSIREQPPPRMRSRSRSRTRQAAAQSPRLSQTGVTARLARGRSNSRSRPMIRSRSRSRIDRVNRMANATTVNSAPITSRLGRRLGGPRVRARSASRQGIGAAKRAIRGGVASGRILKRRNSVKASSAKGASLAIGGVQSRLSRPKGRLPPAAANQRLNRSASKRGNTVRARSRSRSRVGNKPLQRNNLTARGGTTVANRKRGGAQRGRAAVRGTGRRGRSQQRGKSTIVGGVKGNGKGQQQQRRSRGRGNARGGRQLGTDKPDVKKEDLDKELDQYMSSTKSSDLMFS